MEKIFLDIAGEITLSDSPGSSLKKWREIFGISQTELAKFLNVTPSTISDYEGNRRKSPGVNIIKRFVKAIVEIDRQKGGWVYKKLQIEKPPEVYDVHSFSKAVKSKDFVKLIEGRIISNDDSLKKSKVYGYTTVDAVRAILELPADEFIKIYGSTTERALLFTNVALGRSPMVAIRVTKLKPTMVVLHNVSEVDKVALNISEVEKIPIVTTVLPIDEVQRRLKEFVI